MDMFKATTILAVKRGAKLAIAGDGQVSLGNTIMKANAHKIRRVYNDRVITGIAGATADAMTLRDRFSQKLDEFGGNILRSAVELAKDWRSDRMLRRLEAMMIVGNEEALLVLSGSGEVLEPDDGIAAIGSGGSYALAAARALTQHTSMPPAEIVRAAMLIAGDICIYTNKQIVVEEI